MVIAGKFNAFPWLLMVEEDTEEEDSRPFHDKNIQAPESIYDGSVNQEVYDVTLDGGSSENYSSKEVVEKLKSQLRASELS
ncbi:unnamed protein product [Ilex paraguariensis]|uniref:Uncharacterized protein n=1 Tax=Ilex paraguariensis TaxID=185542 RepID=A0ABC8S3N7_9AQUA